MKTFKELAENYSKLLEASLSKANKNVADKKIAAKKAKLKAKKKCKGNMTPSVTVQGTNVKVVCTPKDKSRGRLMKKTAKKLKSNPSMMRKRNAKSSATKAFRK